MQKIEEKILLLYGGGSSESLVSNKTAEHISEILDKLNYDFEKINIDDGSFINKVIKSNNVIIFNALHGGAGEGGTIPAFLDILKKPYTHSGVEASVIGMSKIISNMVAEKLGMNKNLYIEINKASLEGLKKEKNFQEIIANDYFIKPINYGSSIGIDYIKGGGINAIENIDWEQKKTVIIERKIVGKELNVIIYNNKAIGIAEVKCRKGFFDYNSKMDMGYSKEENNQALLTMLDPEELSEDITRQALLEAESFHNYIGCNFLSRVEFIYGKEVGSQENKLFFLEINTHPGLTKNSIYPWILAKSNVTFEECINGLIKSATYNIG